MQHIDSMLLYSARVACLFEILKKTKTETKLLDPSDGADLNSEWRCLWICFVIAKHRLKRAAGKHFVLTRMTKEGNKRMNERLRTKTKGLLYVSTASKLPLSLHFCCDYWWTQLCCTRHLLKDSLFNFRSAMLKESVLPSRCLRTWILHLVQPKTLTLFMKAITISREVSPVSLHWAADLQQPFLCLKLKLFVG